MAVVLYFSLNNSFNPFTIAPPPPGGRGGFGARGGDRRRLRSRHRGIVRMTGSPRHETDRASREILDLLPALAQVADELETDVRRLVARLRDMGVGWDEIASALQLGEDDAKHRFQPAPRV
jgi:hypothetical protein